ncbi:hypothetical protein ACPCSQ_00575 [Streptomyces griseoincarnatus]|nr:hypothetical protein [Streptomyces sp. BSE7-9]MBJ6648076.1 hypothetical protein [Streptomyces sp. BSE7-9]
MAREEAAVSWGAGEAERNVADALSCSVKVPVCRSNTATPAVTPAGT